MSTGESAILATTAPPPAAPVVNSMEALDSGDDLEKAAGDCNESRDSHSGNYMTADSEEDDAGNRDNGGETAPTNTPVNGDSGQASPVMQSSSESLGDESQKQQKPIPIAQPAVKPAAEESKAKSSAKDNKKDDKKKNKKKEDKSIEYILRALNSLQTPEEKLAALCKKYADLHEEHRVLQTSFKTQQRTMAVVMREKDQLQSEHTKAMMAKSKLESLCRELQKQNKIIKDESIKQAREEDERRKEISSQFQTTIGEIQAQMNQNTERNSKLREENGQLAVQLQNIIKQCDAREQQIDKVRKQHDLENQLADAKLAKSDLQLKEERERNAREKELLIAKFTEQAKKSTMLEAQVEMFKERYDDFEKLHSRSSETFQKYKTEMDKMTKRIKKLEKDGMQWKAKWETSNRALLESIEARTKSEKETISYIQRCKKLESLCRALQAERNGMKASSEEPTPESGTDRIDDVDGPTNDGGAVLSSAPPNSPESSTTENSSPDSNPPSSITVGAQEISQAEEPQPSSTVEHVSENCPDQTCSSQPSCQSSVLPSTTAAVPAPTESTPLPVAEPTESTSPSVAEPTESTSPSVAEPTESIPPSVAEPTESTSPSVAEPTESTPLPVAEPTESTSPPVAEPTESTAPSVAQPTESIPPSVAEPTLLLSTTAQATDLSSSDTSSNPVDATESVPESQEATSEQCEDESPECDKAASDSSNTPTVPEQPTSC